MLRRLLHTIVSAARAGLLSLLRARDLALENLALRQQVSSLAAKPHPRPDRFDRAFWAALASIWPSWQRSLGFVRPETVVRWHRAGFRLFWRHKSRRPGRPPIDPELRSLISKMAQENHWGAPRIHGELLKLGFNVSQATVSRYMLSRRRSTSPPLRWSTFLRLHLDGSVGVDFFDIPTATFDVLRGFLVIDGKDSPIPRPRQSADEGAKIVSTPILGGLHHRYERRAA